MHTPSLSLSRFATLKCVARMIHFSFTVHKVVGSFFRHLRNNRIRHAYTKIKIKLMSTERP